MRRIILALLLVFPLSGYGQTAKYILDENDDVKIQFFNSTNVSVISNAVSSNSSAFRNSLGLGQSNNVNFRSVTVSSSVWDGITIDPELGIQFSIDSVSAAARTRTNLGLGAPWLTNTNKMFFRHGIDLGETNTVNFKSVTVGDGFSISTNGILGVVSSDGVTISSSGISFNTAGPGPGVVPTTALNTRKNLGFDTNLNTFWSATNTAELQTALFNSGSLNAQSQRITNLATPVDNNDAATKAYVFNLFNRIAPTVTFTNSVNTVQIGSTITNVNLGWSISPTNTPVASQSITPVIGSMNTSLRATNATGSFTADTTWTLVVNDGTGLPEGIRTNTTSIAFRHYMSWGIASTTSLSNSQIQNLHTNTAAGAGREFRTGKGKSVSISGNGQYIYFAYPASFGAASFIVNNAPNTAWISNTVTYTNSSGNASQFLIYRSTDVQFGTSIPITIN